MGKGCRFDGGVVFSPDKWMEAFLECDIDPHFYKIENEHDEIFPWDHIDIESKEFLFRKPKFRAEITPNLEQNVKYSESLPLRVYVAN